MYVKKLDPKVSNSIRQKALELGYSHGKTPSVRKLLIAIATGEVILYKKEGK